MLTVVSRGAAAALAATVSDTVPLPDPLAPPVTVTHGALLTDVQAHPGPAVTATLVVPPEAGTAAEVGASEYWQAGASAACLTANDRPAIVSVPVLAPPGLAATANSTVPVPVPVAPRRIVIQASLLEAVHEHPGEVFSVVLSVPPAAGAETPDGNRLKEQAVPSWLTLTARPATSTVPSRAAPVLAATEKEAVPDPDPELPAVMVIQVALLAALQAQPPTVFTLTEADPPAAPMVMLAGATV